MTNPTENTRRVHCLPPTPLAMADEIDLLRAAIGELEGDDA